MAAWPVCTVFRPHLHHTRELIEAQLTIVFAALDCGTCVRELLPAISRPEPWLAITSHVSLLHARAAGRAGMPRPRPAVRAAREPPRLRSDSGQDGRARCRSSSRIERIARRR